MSNEILYGVNNFYSNENIFVNDCGKQIFGEKNIINVVRKKGRHDYHILLISKGSCTFEYDNKTYTLNEKELIIYYPNEPQRYFWGTTYSESYWLHFSGLNIPELLETCSLKSGVYKCTELSKVSRIFDELIVHYNKKRSTPDAQNTDLTDLKINTLLVLLLCEISDNINLISPQTTIVFQVLNEIHEHYNEKISFEKIARNNAIGEARLVQIFKSAIGFTPQKYQKNYQIKQAEHLIIHSKYPISQIAQNVGFDDPLYFSRVFKSVTSLSPNEYRTKYKKLKTTDLTTNYDE